MNISRNDLYRIVIEEYLREEGLSLEESKAQELIDYIKGDGPKPDWYEQEKDTPEPPKVPPIDTNKTYPMEIPGDDAPESEYRGFQNDSGPDIEDQLSALIQGMDAETVAELFQSVFEKIPGVELSSPGDEDYPGEETLYNPGAEGRPAISLGPLREYVADKAFRKVIEMAGLSYGTHSISGVPGQRDDEDEEVVEGEYRDMEDEGELYNALDPHGFENMSDAELIDMMHTDGMEEMIVLDGEGDLANREEVILALKDV